MIAVAVASEAVLARYDANKANLEKLADPRLIKMNDAEALRLSAETTPVYYITGAIHSTESGSPTALMELAYRLAVDDSAYVKNIRDHLITLITPVVETDGRDRMVDLYEYGKKYPDRQVPNLLYWGKYVAHDNNRDAMGMTLKLTENVLGTYIDHKAQVLQSASSRLSERINWSTIQFLLENAVFLLIGLQVKQVVQEARAAVEKQVRLPSGRYHATWGGQFEHYESARWRLMLVIPVAILLIFGLLYATYGNLVDSLRVFTGVPLGWVGGIFGLYVVLMVSAAGVFISHESSGNVRHEPAATVAMKSDRAPSQQVRQLASY